MALSGGGTRRLSELAVELALRKTSPFGKRLLPRSFLGSRKSFSIKSYPMQKRHGGFSPPKTPQDCINYTRTPGRRTGAVYTPCPTRKGREKEMRLLRIFCPPSGVHPGFWIEAKRVDLLHYAVTFFYASARDRGEKTFSVELKEQNGPIRRKRAGRERLKIGIRKG
jgi:hypothetical protein